MIYMTANEPEQRRFSQAISQVMVSISPEMKAIFREIFIVRNMTINNAYIFIA
jgi:hypothetical protein